MAWPDELLPASFRGVPFQVDNHQWSGGRRLVDNQFPQRDTPYVEDLGRRAQRFRMRAYVIADIDSQEYFNARDDLRDACQADGSGLLVHPYLGAVTVFCETVEESENITSGGMAVFDLMFWEDGSTPSPTVTQDTAASLLSGINGVLSEAIAAYAIGSLIAQRPTVLLGLAEGLAGDYVSDVLGISTTVAGQLAGIGGTLVAALGGGGGFVTSTVTGLTGDPVAIAATDLAISAAQIILTPAATPAVTITTGETSTADLMPPDPSGGMAALATFGTGLNPPVGLGAAQAATLQTTIVDLVRTSAVLAVTQIYASTDWTVSNAATAARNQLLGFLDERIGAAATAAQDALYQAWLSLYGLAAQDLVQRAQALPMLTTYSFTTGLPACVIAEALYQDGTRGLQLAALNNAPHPGFLPASGLALAA